MCWWHPGWHGRKTRGGGLGDAPVPPSMPGSPPQMRRWEDTRAWRCSCSALSLKHSTWALPWMRVSIDGAGTGMCLLLASLPRHQHPTCFQGPPWGILPLGQVPVWRKMLLGQSSILVPPCPTHPLSVPTTGLASPSDTFSVFYGERSPWCEYLCAHCPVLGSPGCWGTDAIPGFLLNPSLHACRDKGEVRG